MSILENSYVDADTTGWIRWFGWLLFVIHREGGVPLTSPFLFDTHLFDRDVIGDFTMVAEWDVSEFFE